MRDQNRRAQRGTPTLATGRRREPPQSNRHRHADERIRRKHTSATPGGCHVRGPRCRTPACRGGERPAETARIVEAIRQRRSALALPSVALRSSAPASADRSYVAKGLVRFGSARIVKALARETRLTPRRQALRTPSKMRVPPQRVARVPKGASAPCRWPGRCSVPTGWSRCRQPPEAIRSGRGGKRRAVLRLAR